MSADLLSALGIAGAILLGVVVFIVVISIAMVKRGETSMHGGNKRNH